MAFRNAGTVIVARLFRLINNVGQTVAALGNVGLSTFLNMMHNDGTYLDSQLEWSRFDGFTVAEHVSLIGPDRAAIAGAPPSITLAQDSTITATGMASVTIDSGVSKTGGQEATLFITSRDDGSRIALNAGAQVVLTCDVAGGPSVELKPTQLNISSNTVPQSFDAGGNFIGWHYARAAAVYIQAGANVPCVNGVYTDVVVATFTCKRDRFAVDVTGLNCFQTVVAGAGNAHFRIIAIGGPFGGGAQIGIDLYSGFNGFVGEAISQAITYFTEGIAAAGTVITIKLQNIKDIAGGNVQSLAGLCALELIPHL